jgi:hypothetical protein
MRAENELTHLFFMTNLLSLPLERNQVYHNSARRATHAIALSEEKVYGIICGVEGRMPNGHHNKGAA